MKKVLFFISLFVIVLNCYSKPVSQKTAESVAIKWYANHTIKNGKDFTIEKSSPTIYNGLITYYTFYFKSGGFVMVAADDASMPILGYSMQGMYIQNEIPVNLQEWLDSYSQQIKKIVNTNADNKETLKEWVKILNENIDKSVQQVAPLCATTWDQSSPYNKYCPLDGSQRVLTGCVATALAQVMKKWNWPVAGQGVHQYNNSGYGSLTINYDTVSFDWANMLNSYNGSTLIQKNAVGLLMYGCGVAVEMGYGLNASATDPENCIHALVAHFKYQPSLQFVFKNSYSGIWSDMLKAELDAGRPIIYSGFTSTGGVGHCFVCDGYDNAGLFNFNWGWSGSYNGYYAIGSLNPGTDYSNENNAVIGIQPLQTNALTADFSGTPVSGNAPLTVQFTDLSTTPTGTTITTRAWNFGDGSTSTLQNPSHIYTSAGTYTVALTVTNSASATNTNTKANYITVTVPGTNFPMNNTTVTTCTGIFYDSGDNNANYTDNEEKVMTFLPGTTGSMLRFTFTGFDVEAHASCDYDYLEIYDGNTTNSNLIGKYCGTTSPGIITATNTQGAITFKFHSDVNTNNAGWAANIECVISNTILTSDFSGTPVSGNAPLTVQFTDLSTTPAGTTISTRAWNFGDGGTSTQQNPSHIYTTAGTYTVALTVTNSASATNTNTKANYITVIQGGTDPCEDLSTDYTMGFEINENINEWNVENIAGDTATWKIFNNSTYTHSGSQGISYYFNTDATTPANDWLFTKCLNLDAGQNYELSFWYRVRAGSSGTVYPEKLKVAIGDQQNHVNMTQIIHDFGALNNIVYQQAVNQFTVPAIGTYYVGFHCYSDFDEYELYVDDIQLKKITPTSSGLSNIANFVSIYPNPATDQISINVQQYAGLVNVELFTIHGQQIGSIKSVNNETIIYDTKELSNGIYFIKIISSKGTFTSRVEIIK